MARNILQDIKPLTRKDPPQVYTEPRVEQQLPPQNPEPPYIVGQVIRPEYKKRPSGFLWLLALVAVFILFFALSLFLSGATITITPKEVKSEIDTTLTAIKGNSDAVLPFEIMTLDGEETQTVKSTGKTTTGTKATGTVIIYNKFSTVSQKLIETTRIESPEGKIYRLDETVIVPGEKTENGTTLPGSVEVTVTADAGGEAYNIGLSDFTIPGFKGDPRYTKFEVRSKTEMSGGSSGSLYTIDEATLTNIRASLGETLKEKLEKQAIGEIPKGYLYFSAMNIFKIDTASSISTSKEENVPVTLSGTLTAFIFPESSFTSAIASKTIENYDTLTDVRLANPKDITVVFENKDSINPDTISSARIHISGQPVIIWKTDTKALIEDLKGIRKKDFQSILVKYPSIENAELNLKPFWIVSLPKNENDIRVVEVSLSEISESNN